MFVTADVKLSNCVDCGYSGLTHASCFVFCIPCPLPTQYISVLHLSWGLLFKNLKIGIYRRGWGGRVFVEKAYRSSKWWEVKDWGESVSELMIVKKKNNYQKLYTVLSCLGVCTLVHVVKFEFVSCVLLLVLSCLLCNCCWLTVCIVVVVWCVLSSYVYLLYCVYCCFYFRCRTAG